MARPLKPKTPMAARLIEVRGVMDRDEFASLLGVPTSTLANYEQGERAPPIEVLRAIRQRTGVSLDWLIMGEGEMRPSQEIPPASPEAAPPTPPRHYYHRPLMHALIKLYIEESRSLRVALPADELADKVLAMYDRSIDEVLAMADEVEKVA